MMDRFLGWFGFVRRAVVEAERDAYKRMAEKLANDLKVEEWRRKVDHTSYRAAEAGHLKVISALMDEVMDRSAS